MDSARKPERSIVVRISAKSLAWGLAGLAACLAVYGLFSDTLTMTAYYPSPQGVYWKLWSTADAVFGRDQLANPSASSVVQIGGDNVKGQYNSQTSESLTVWGNTKVLVNPQQSGSGNLTVSGTTNLNAAANVFGLLTAQSGITVPRVAAGGPCSGNIAAGDGSGNAYICTSGTWKALGGGGSNPSNLGPPGTILTITGNNPPCPAGTSTLDTYWTGGNSCTGTDPITGQVWSSAYTSTPYYQPAPNSCDGSCTTTTGWQSKGYGSCSYTNGGYYNYYAYVRGSRPYTNCNSSSCPPSAWTQVQCRVN